MAQITLIEAVTQALAWERHLARRNAGA